MKSSTPATQTTLLTSHKGVDLHAASALLVMQQRLAGGEQLVNLLRCELHSFWGRPRDWDVERLLGTGRYFNPNKHHFGVFAGPARGTDWFAGAVAGRSLASGWLGGVVDTDLSEFEGSAEGLYRRLLGGTMPDDCSPCDIVSFPFGQRGPILSGVLWRLVIRGAAGAARIVGEQLAVARHRQEGLLVNPHMDCWFTAD